MMTQNYDNLHVLLGGGYKVNDKININQPTMGDVFDLGEQAYYGMVSAFTAIPSDMIAELWEQGIDWTDISDFELFTMLVRGLPVEQTAILFGRDIDFTKFDLYLNNENNMLFLQDENGVVIDMNIHRKISQFICWMHGIIPKREMPFNKLTKKVMLREAQGKLEAARRKPYKSMLYNQVSAMVNSPGFKYDYSTIRSLGIVAFTDAVKRISCITSTNNLILGAYMGNIDTKKIDKKEFDWMRDLNVDKRAELAAKAAARPISENRFGSPSDNRFGRQPDFFNAKN